MPFSSRHHDESKLRPTHSDTHPLIFGELYGELRHYSSFDTRPVYG